jgi:hypothetical protein
VYKTVKADGSVVYTDTPTDSSTPVTLSAVNNVVPALSQPNLQINPATQAKPRKVTKNYVVSVTSPAPAAHIRNNLGQVTIAASVNPKGAGQFQLVLNGQVNITQASHLFELENIDRGAHTIKVNYVDNSGKILASSDSQTFYLHKASALIKAN